VLVTSKRQNQMLKRMIAS